MFVTRLYRSVTALMCMLALSLAQSGPAAAADRVELISLQSGHSVLLSTPGLQRVAVGDGTIAGVVPLGTSQLVINGKAPGHTTVFVWAGGHRATYEVTVTEQQLDDLAQMLRTSLREPNVQIVSFDHSVVVRGTVSDGAQFQQINEIVGRFDKVAEHGTIYGRQRRRRRASARRPAARHRQHSGSERHSRRSRR